MQALQSPDLLSSDTNARSCISVCRPRDGRDPEQFAKTRFPLEPALA